MNHDMKTVSYYKSFGQGKEENLDKSSDEAIYGNLIEEYCDGGNLNEYVDRYEGLLSIDLVESIFAQILKSQLYIHFEKNLIHRDVKLNNYLVVNAQPYPIIKLTDFCFVTSLDDNLNQMMGTPLYLPLEVMMGGKITDRRDIYSIGICLYYLITKKFPFSTSKNLFFECMTTQKPIVLPSQFDQPQYKQLSRLVISMTKHNADERMSWEQLRDDEYVKYIISKY